MAQLIPIKRGYAGNQKAAGPVKSYLRLEEQIKAIVSGLAENGLTYERADTPKNSLKADDV
jgi:hypothetical protein